MYICPSIVEVHLSCPLAERRGVKITSKLTAESQTGDSNILKTDEWDMEPWGRTTDNINRWGGMSTRTRTDVDTVCCNQIIAPHSDPVMTVQLCDFFFKYKYECVYVRLQSCGCLIWANTHRVSCPEASFSVKPLCIVHAPARCMCHFTSHRFNKNWLLHSVWQDLKSSG